MDRILISLKKENGPRASSALALGLNTIIFKHVYWYMQQTQMSVYRTIGPLVSYLGSGFWALEYRSPQRTNTPLSYIVQYMATHIHAKAFVGSQGGTILYKTFS